MAKIASRIAQLTGEGALAVFTRAKELEKAGRSIIHLELGEPDFHPAAPVVDAVRAAVAEGRDRYVATRGIPPLRSAIAEYLKRTRRLDVAAEQVLVAPGCKMALALAMMALIELGDEVLYPDPSFPIYPSFTRGLGAQAIPYALREENKFQPDLAEIAAKITPKTRMLIFNSPNNPTGTVFTDAVIAQIAELAKKHDLWVIADEIYARILFSGEYKSIWTLPGMAERTVIIDGFSKSFAMTGWRLGYAVAQKHVIDALDMLVLNTFTCTAEFSQVAAIEALRDSTNAVPAMVEEYRKRRDLFVEKLNRIPGFRCLSPDGAFYAWVNIEETGMPAEEVQRVLLEEAGVAGIAGAAFGAEGKNYLRFSLVSATHLLEDALERIQRVSSRWRAAVVR
ncbi:MAG TPA: aminotransferase class I/II-fold pyridoxal phosphate-dependent enzyme [Candidatus Acidoferrum sp.]|jgi:aspartate/methionine/tyrosine aminotransferase|nr:aminotransferase class I/II-fold pyridoxal phosphate-dependent enzyme [Candidatus Acidoferrum sp.]